MSLFALCYPQDRRGGDLPEEEKSKLRHALAAQPPENAAAVAVRAALRYAQCGAGGPEFWFGSRDVPFEAKSAAADRFIFICRSADMALRRILRVECIALRDFDELSKTRRATTKGEQYDFVLLAIAHAFDAAAGIAPVEMALKASMASIRVAYYIPAIDPAAEYSYSASAAAVAANCVASDIQMLIDGATLRQLAELPLWPSNRRTDWLTVNAQLAALATAHAQRNLPALKLKRLWTVWREPHGLGVMYKIILALLPKSERPDPLPPQRDLKLWTEWYDARMQGKSLD
jgi:hypothetical protein